MNFSRSGIPLLILLLLAPTVAGASPLQRFEYRQMHMGVETRIVFYAPDTTTATTAATRAFARIADLDSIMSDYRVDSELNRLVSVAGGPPMRIGDDLFHVLWHARDLARLSDGAFDVTAAPVTHLWRAARQRGIVPPEEELRAAARLVGWRHLELDPENRTARLRLPGMRIDLGGIGKGYASSEAIATLRQHGVDQALVQMGGDIVVGSPPPGEPGWRIQVQAANDSRSLWLRDAALSTSGDTEQFLEIDGVRYSHIVDPRTGLGLRTRTEVTVMAPDGMLADALSTLLSVLGGGEAEPFVAAHFPCVRIWVRTATDEATRD